MTECYFTPKKETTSATICANCGLEKSLHTIGEGVKVNKVIITTEAEIQHQIEIDDDEDSMWDDGDEEIIGYHCLGCGNIQNRDTGFGCDRCTGHSLEPWYG